MLYLRSLLFLIGQIITVVLYAPVAFAAYPLDPVTRSRIIGYWAHFIVWWLKLTCGLRHEVHGSQHVPSRPCVILSKHQSAWETIAFQTIFPPQAWVLKKRVVANSRVRLGAGCDQAHCDRSRRGSARL